LVQGLKPKESKSYWSLENLIQWSFSQVDSCIYWSIHLCSGLGSKLV